MALRIVTADERLAEANLKTTRRLCSGRAAAARPRC
jgi:hypothetical protein